MSYRWILLVTLVVSACTSTAPEPSPASSALPAVFPVTVKHSLGETTVPKKPEKVVALGFADVAVANRLDAYLVAAVRYPEADGPNLPYVDAQLSEEVLSLDAAKVDPAKVASYQPDLILATSVPLDAARYAELSRIAPTVATSGSTVDDDAKLIGDAVGNPAGAAKLVDTSRKLARQFKDEMPKVSGKLYASAEPLPFLDSLGMVRANDGLRIDQPTVVGLLRDPNPAGTEWLVEQLRPVLKEIS